MPELERSVRPYKGVFSQSDTVSMVGCIGEESLEHATTTVMRDAESVMAFSDFYARQS